MVGFVSPPLAQGRNMDGIKSSSTSDLQGVPSEDVPTSTLISNQGRCLKSFSLLKFTNSTNSDHVSAVDPNLDADSLDSSAATSQRSMDHMSVTINRFLNEMENRARIAEADRKALEARLLEATQTAEANRNAFEARLLESTQIAEADRKAFEARFLEKTNELEARILISNEMRAEIEALQQQSVAKNTWAVLRNVQELIVDAISNVHKLPPYSIVPHMRPLSAFKSDADAIKIPPTQEELDMAERYINSLNPNIIVRDFVEEEIEDAVAITDRGKSGSIWFSTDLQWGLERLLDGIYAQFLCRATLYHECGHGAWFEFRGEGKDRSPESFKGTHSKNKGEGTEVMYACPRPLPKQDALTHCPCSLGARRATCSTSCCSEGASILCAYSCLPARTRSCAWSTIRQAGPSRAGTAC